MATTPTIKPPQEDTSSEYHAGGGFPLFTVSTYEEMNPARRNTMEDCSVVRSPGTWGSDFYYFAIYDGHGGRDMVDYLEHGLEFFIAQELRREDNSDMATRLRRSFIMADVHAAQQGVKTSGATVVVCLVKILIHTANCGDARAVLGFHGRATRLSQDHRLDDPREAERIEKAGGFLFKGRVLGVLAVTRSLGDHCMKDFVVACPYYNETKIDETEKNNNNFPTVLILACDGLWDVIEDQEAVDLALSFGGEKADAAQYLVEEALGRGSSDNVSVIVVWL